MLWSLRLDFQQGRQVIEELRGPRIISGKWKFWNCVGFINEFTCHVQRCGIFQKLNVCCWWSLMPLVFMGGSGKCSNKASSIKRLGYKATWQMFMVMEQAWSSETIDLLSSCRDSIRLKCRGLDPYPPQSQFVPLSRSTTLMSNLNFGKRRSNS